MMLKGLLEKLATGKKIDEAIKPAEEMDATNIDRPMTLGEVHKLGKGKSFTKGVGGEK